jgi:hypothetical protein
MDNRGERYGAARRWAILIAGDDTGLRVDAESYDVALRAAMAVVGCRYVDVVLER